MKKEFLSYEQLSCLSSVMLSIAYILLPVTTVLGVVNVIGCQEKESKPQPKLPQGWTLVGVNPEEPGSRYYVAVAQKGDLKIYSIACINSSYAIENVIEQVNKIDRMLPK